jgi:hypothetical protein
MRQDQYVKELNELLRTYHEKIQRPQLDRLNQIYEARRKREREDIGAYFDSLAAYGLDRQKLSDNWESQQRRLSDFERRKIGLKPSRIVSAKEDCIRIRRFIESHAHRLGSKHLQELQPLYRTVHSSHEPNKVDFNFDAADLIEARESKRAWGWPDRFHAKAQSRNSIYGIEDEVTLEWGYDFVPASYDPYRIFLKWDGEGIYFIYSDDRDPHYPSEARLSMKLDLFIGQWLGNIHIHRITWPIFTKEGRNIIESDWLGGFEYSEWQRTLSPESVALVTVRMTLTCYSKIHAFSILDFEEHPFWVNFTVFMSQ